MAVGNAAYPLSTLYNMKAIRWCSGAAPVMDVGQQHPCLRGTSQPWAKWGFPHHIPAVSAPWASTWVEAVFTTWYQQGDAGSRSRFSAVTPSAFPSKIKKPPVTQRLPPLRGLPGSGHCKPCTKHSLIASAGADRRQQQDFLLLFPGKAKKICWVQVPCCRLCVKCCSISTGPASDWDKGDLVYSKPFPGWGGERQALWATKPKK